MSFGDSLRKAHSGEYIEPPAAKYTVNIVKGDAHDSKIGPVAEIILKITEGELADGLVKHVMFFNHPVGTEINTEALAGYGVDLTKIEEVNDLDDELQRLVGTRAEVGISYRNDYIQIKVHRSWPPEPVSDIPSDEGEKPASSFAAASGSRFGDDVPFD